MATKLRLAATAVALIAFAVFGFAGPAAADEPVTNCSDIGNGTLCIAVENGPDYHKVAVGYLKDAGSPVSVNLTYYGIDWDEHRADYWQAVSAGGQVADFWEWEHRSPSGCYTAAMYVWGPTDERILGNTVCI